MDTKQALQAAVAQTFPDAPASPAAGHSKVCLGQRGEWEGNERKRGRDIEREVERERERERERKREGRER